jgi:hypothetical protein
MSSVMRSCARTGRFLATYALLAAAACSEPNPGPGTDEEASLQVTVVTRDVLVDRITAEVTGPGIAPALLFNLTLANGVASGTLRVPPGDDRTITLRAFEDTGELSYEGSATIDVRPGMNPTVNIVLRSRAGQLPISGSIGSISVEVLGPSSISIAGSSAQYTARVYNVADGTEFTVADGDIEWAVSNPALAEVSATGLVTTLGGSGTVLVVANYDGVAGVASVQVGSGSASLGTVQGSVVANQAFFDFGYSLGELVVAWSGPLSGSDVISNTGAFEFGSLPFGSYFVALAAVPPGCTTDNANVEVGSSTPVSVVLEVNCSF